MLLVTIEKFETNLVLVNVNKLKPYKYMESKVQKKEQQMLVYWVQSAGGVQEVNFDIEEDNERCEIQKTQMKTVEDKEWIIDPVMNIVFIVNLQMSNNCKSAKFGMERFNDDMSGVLAKSIATFILSLKVFAQSLELWAKSTKKSANSPDVFS